MKDTKPRRKSGAPAPDRWRLEGAGIAWHVADDPRLPHEDHIEMSGRKVSVIVRYGVDENRHLTLTRRVIWPTLRTKEGDVRGYTRRDFGLEVEPYILVDGRPVTPGPVALISLYGMLRILQECGGLTLDRRVYPSVDKGHVVEEWHLHNVSDRPVRLAVRPGGWWEEASGVYGRYLLSAHLQAPEKWAVGREAELGAGLTAAFAIEIRAESPENPEASHATPYRLTGVWRHATGAEWELRARLQRRDDVQAADTVRVRTPDRVLNKLFDFAKFRAAESLFETKMGLVHSPGGGSYYGGIWNNDQCEYSGPLFAYLGDPDAYRAALTAYRNFAPYMTPAFEPLPTSLEMEGTIEIHAGGDRGDAAMYASGAARFALAGGDRAVAEELYPHIAWCLEYCHRKTNAAGVVASDCDELEGRFPTGDANLSTSCLAYDGLRRAADLARSLGRAEDAATYDQRADELEAAIERHFGANVEGFETYRYYDGNTILRAWICLPLAFGITRRTAGTVAALFSPRLWTPEGLATEAGDKVFWDRSTLYGLRGVFFAGETETALEHLTAYSRRRLLGDHVPYPVEAYPEGGQAHLSAESALYCRVYTEGLFGLVPTGLRSFTLTPRLPAAWPKMSLDLTAFGHRLKITARREGDAVRTTVIAGKDTVLDRSAESGATQTVSLPD